MTDMAVEEAMHLHSFQSLSGSCGQYHTGNFPNLCMELLVGFEYHYQHVFTMLFEQNSGKVQIYLQVLKKILILINKLFYIKKHKLL